MKITKKAYVNPSFCVGCGVCKKVCPLEAILINTKIQAEVLSDKCVGCGKCARACPASTISIKTTEEV